MSLESCRNLIWVYIICNYNSLLFDEFLNQVNASHGTVPFNDMCACTFLKLLITLHVRRNLGHMITINHRSKRMMMGLNVYTMGTFTSTDIKTKVRASM